MWTRSIALFVFTFLGLLAVATAGKLIRLDDDNVESTFRESLGKDWIILFSNKKTTPVELVKTFREFAVQMEDFLVGKVECTTDPDLCLDFEISKRSGPVIILITASGDRTKYTGQENSIDAWKKWAHNVRHGSVQVLTHTTWNESISTGQWFVKYYAPWCNHCQQMAPVWREFSEEHKNHFKVAKFDCTIEEHKPICEAENVKAFPIMIFYINGERYRHIGGRTKDEFIRTVKLARRGLADDDTDDEALSLEPPDQGSASAEYEEIIV